MYWLIAVLLSLLFVNAHPLMTDDEFARAVHELDRKLIAPFRESIACQFDLAPEKILPTDTLQEDYDSFLLPSSLGDREFCLRILHEFMDKLDRPLVESELKLNDIRTLTQLAKEVQRVIDHQDRADHAD